MQPYVSDRKRDITEMCSGSEAGSYVRLIDFVYHSTLGLRVIRQKRPAQATLILHTPAETT